MNDASLVKSVCMDADEIERSVTRIAHQILEANKGAENLALVGIVTRGDLLAKMLAHKIQEIEGPLSLHILPIQLPCWSHPLRPSQKSLDDSP